ncbi:Mg2+ and Co2+ transporter CorA [Peptoniphilus ivorii]|nr:Mg2+ and Co2+ transporter CorA [Peptoniphilus ivorii]
MEKLGDLYSNVINNNLNEVMKTLTSITILMTVPTIVGGYWGMNTELPIQKAPFAFWWLILLSVVVILLLTWYLKKKDYL